MKWSGLNFTTEGAIISKKDLTGVSSVCLAVVFFLFAAK